MKEMVLSLLQRSCLLLLLINYLEKLILNCSKEFAQVGFHDSDWLVLCALGLVEYNLENPSKYLHRVNNMGQSIGKMELVKS